MGWGALGMAAATAATQLGANALQGGINNAQKYKQWKKIAPEQLKMNDLQAAQNYKWAMKLWESTGYGAQKEQMKEAGLNPALLYGMSGGGGQTTNAGGANANVPDLSTEQPAPAMGMALQSGMQMELLKAQKENIEADTANKQADTTKKSGVDTEKAAAETKSLTQGIENQKAVEELTKIQSRIAGIDEWIKGKSKEDAADAIMWQAKKTMNEVNLLRIQGIVDQATYDEKIGIIERELTAKILQNELTRGNIALNKVQIDKANAEIMQIATNIQKMYADVKLKSRELDIHQVEAEIKQFEATMRANYPGIGQVTGGMINSVVRKLEEMFGLGKEYTQPNKP